MGIKPIAPIVEVYPPIYNACHHVLQGFKSPPFRENPVTQLSGILRMESVVPAIETDAQKTIPSPWEFSCDLEVDYKSDNHARIVYSALSVDKELQPDKVRRLMSVSDGKLSVHFEATEARFLRASYSAFMDALTLATQTIEQFGDSMALQHQIL
ncbi:hypothetical protein L1887_16955 [Cichorium endivia]|nr:hypothetical protein L1887_16955 [Cichorium endivia]